MSLLGVDVGTTGCKSIAFDGSGRVLAEARREYPLMNPKPGYWELDAEQVWRDVAATIAEVAAATKADPITALAVSALGEAVVPVGHDRRPLAGGPVSADFRAPAQMEKLSAALGDAAIYAITGQPGTAFYSLPKMMWWRETTPELYDRVWKFLCFGDYVLARMGLDPVIDPSMAARTLAFDIHRGEWSETILQAAGIPVDRLPAVMPSGTLVGHLDAGMAASLGLPPSVAVVTGGFDQACGALGVGVVDAGTGFYGLGTTEALALVVEPPLPNLETLHVALCPHVAPGRMLAMAGSQTGGRLLHWYRNEFAAREEDVARASGRDVYEVILDSLSPEPSPLIVLPHFTGSGTIHNDPYSKGAIIGLTFDSKRSDVAKAVLEGVTYEQASCLDHLDAAGVAIRRLMVVGGGARSDTALQIKADIMGRDLCRPETSDASCLGAALLAGLATGVYSDLADVKRIVERDAVTFVPDPDRRRVYRQRLAVYEGLYDALIGASRELDRVRA